MDFDLSAAQEAFRDEVRQFVREHLPSAIRERLRRGQPPTKDDIVFWQKALNQRGWAVPHWPKQYGGSELTQTERLILLDELYSAPAPLPQVFNCNMLGPVLLRYGSEEQKDTFLPKLANLDLWFCQGFSEPGAGSDLASLRTRARRDGDFYVVDGQKIWTTTAHLADWVFALVRTGELGAGKKQEGISFLLIDLKSPGVDVKPIRSIDGGHHLNEVFFDSVKVPVSQRVGNEGQGWEIAKFLLSNERTGIANVGLCYERLDLVCELLRTRYRSLAGRYRNEVVTLRAEIRALDVTNWRYLTDESSQHDLPAFSSVLKLKGTELQQRVAHLLATITGTEGLIQSGDKPEDTPLVPRYFYSRAASIYGGASEVQKDILGNSLLKRSVT